jgi:hypothetical protein
MSFLKKLFGGSEPPLPEWANVIKASDFEDFQKYVRQAVANRMPNPTFHFDEGYIEDGEGREFGLHNIVRIVAPLNKSEWPQTINDFFGHMWDFQTVDEGISNLPFEELKSRIRVRFYALDIPTEGIVVNQVGVPNVICMTCLDLPNSVMSVTEEKQKEWGVSIGELFQLGLENVWNQDHPQSSAPLDNRYPDLVIHEGESFFIASRALLLDRMFDPWPSFGVAYAIPMRQMLITLPLRTKADASLLGSLQNIAAEIFNDLPGGISPAAYVYTGSSHFVISADNPETQDLLQILQQA